ncbi:hypothetical protein ANCDUO_03837 [Ancylostoma duodenale]|uniref:VWFA domain-containing protein n=1 Tax=Ancylostoma duodenale TaxID=51022 RepID=A0A0C2H2S8_9BILA|nr:hypothetical protein ANCDUO_03837 [Ancylostoma duodenale]
MVSPPTRNACAILDTQERTVMYLSARITVMNKEDLVTVWLISPEPSVNKQFASLIMTLRSPMSVSISDLVVGAIFTYEILYILDRTFVIMLETSYNMGATIFQMKKNLKKALDKINNDPTTKGWFTKFILYPFDSVSNKDYWYKPVISSNSDDIVNAVKNITTTACPGPNGCSPTICEPHYDATFTDVDRTFVIMLETSYNMGATIFQMKKNLKKALDRINTDPTTKGWFTKFILYPFDSVSNKDYWYKPVVSSNSDDIVNAVKNITTTACPGPNGCSPNCARPIMETLKTVLAMKEVAVPNSVILVVSRSSPEDYTLINGMIQQLMDSKAQVNDTGAVRAGTYRLTMTGAGGQYCQMNIRGRSSVEQYLVIVYGRDSMGATIRRNFMTNCVATRPDQPPGKPTCDLSEVKQDTLFIIDASQQNANSTENFKSVAAMTLADTAQGGFSYNAPEHSFDNVQMLLSNLTFLGRPGQNVTRSVVFIRREKLTNTVMVLPALLLHFMRFLLFSAMQLAIGSYGSANQGYRPSARHMIVYVTSANPTDDDPASLVYTIRRQGLYQISVITVGITPSEKLLSIVAKDCLYQAADVDDLMTNGVNFVQGLSCS